MAEKDRRIAEIEKHILNEIEDAKAAKRREQAENASPRCVCFVTLLLDFPSAQSCTGVSDNQVFVLFRLAHLLCLSYSVTGALNTQHLITTCTYFAGLFGSEACPGTCPHHASHVGMPS